MPGDRGRVRVESVQIPSPTGNGNVTGYTVRTPEGKLLRGISGSDNLDPEFYKMIHERGINAMRITFMDPYSRFDEGADYLHFDGSDSAGVNDYLFKLEKIVNLASMYGIYIMINFHCVDPYGACADKTCTPEIAQYAKEYWGTVAPFFKNRTHVFYEITNEPNGGNNMQQWSEVMIQDQKDIYDLVRQFAPETHIVLASPSGFCSNNQTTDLVDLADKINAKGIDWSNTSIGFHPYKTCGTSKALRLAMAKYPVINTEQNVANSFVNKCFACDPFGSESMDGENWGVQTMERLQISWFHWVMDTKPKIDVNYAALVQDAKVKGYMWKTDSIITGPAVALKTDTSIYYGVTTSLSISPITVDTMNNSIESYVWEQIYPDYKFIGSFKTPNLELNNLQIGTFQYALYTKGTNGYVGGASFTLHVIKINAIPGQVEAEHFSNMSGVYNSGSIVGSQDTGDWLEYECDVEEKGNYQVELSVCRGSDGDGAGSFYKKSTIISSIFKVPFTDANWSAFKSIYTNVSLDQGRQVIKLKIDQGAWNNDYMKFSKLPVFADAGKDKKLYYSAPIIITGSALSFSSIASYKWTKISGGNATMTNDETPKLTIGDLGIGEYVFRLTATDSDGNSAFDEVLYTITGCNRCTTLVNKVYNSTFKVYPIPAKDYITIEFTGKSYKSSNLYITNLEGKTIVNFHIETGVEKINVPINKLSKGFYYIRCENSNEISYKQLIVQ